MTIKFINPDSTNPFCVLGVADTDKGRAIAAEMREWLKPNYCVIEIWHDGSLFEQPALHYMQYLCKETDATCLYLHTRGAFNFHKTTTERTHKLWRHEFTTKRDWYFEQVAKREPTAACPFTGSEKYTWYNGFVVNANAMKAIPEIKPNEDRLFFEHLFKGTPVNVIGAYVNEEDGENLASLVAARKFLTRNFK